GGAGRRHDRRAHRLRHVQGAVAPHRDRPGEAGGQARRAARRRPSGAGMTARVLYFASLRDDAGRAEEAVPAGGTLAALYARLRWTRAQLRVAVDGAFAAWDDPVPPGAEVAFIPPVSGG